MRTPEEEDKVGMQKKTDCRKRISYRNRGQREDRSRRRHMMRRKPGSIRRKKCQRMKMRTKKEGNWDKERTTGGGRGSTQWKGRVEEYSGGRAKKKGSE